MGGGPAQLAQIDNQLTQIDQKVTGLQNAVNSALDWVPWFLGWIVDKIKDLWNALMDKLHDLYHLLEHIVQNMGAPWDLQHTSDAWANQVGGPVSARSQLGNAGALAVDDNWDGTAADQYRQKMVLQALPMDKMRLTFSDGIGNALSTAQTGIYTFWGCLAGALAELIGGLVAAAAASGTIIGIPAGLVAVIATVGAVAITITGGIMALKAQLSSAEVTLRQRMNDNSGFLDTSGTGGGGGSGHWPKFVTG